MNVFVDRLAASTKKNHAPTRFVWQVREKAEARAQIAAHVAERHGSWIDGDDFQISASSDPCAPVLSGTIRSRPQGAEVTATIGPSQEVKDILRFGRLLLLGFLALVVTGLSLQSEGPELAVALVGIAMGCAAAGAVAALFEARLGERCASRANVGQLTHELSRLLR